MKNKFLDQRTITFLFSLLISFGLWLLIKLSDDFQTDNRIELRYQNYPINKVLTNKPDSLLQIKTINNGFDILGHLLFKSNQSIPINFAYAKHLKTRNGVQTYYILSSSLHNQIADKFSTAEEILSVRPDSLIFAFEELTSKQLPVKPQLEWSLNPRFKQYKNMQLIPNKVKVFGPASILNKIDSIPTEKIKLEQVSQSIDTLLHLKLKDSRLNIQPKNVKLVIPIEEFTEGKIKLPIQIKASKNLNYKIFPPDAQLTYQVALKDYSKVKLSDFELIGIPDKNESVKLILKVSKQPKNVIVSHIQPASAEYIILK